MIPLEEPAKTEELFLLSYLRAKYASIDMQYTYIVAAQHINQSTYQLINTLFRLGLEKKHLSLIGKCYSTDPALYDTMREEGIDVSSFSLAFSSHESFDAQYQKYIKAFVTERWRKIRKKGLHKIVILDEGNFLIREMSNRGPADPRFIGIEHTSCGMLDIQSSRLSFPVINVARSYAKLHYEAPLVAHYATRALFDQLDALSITPQKCLLIGRGYLGESVAQNLQDLFPVSIFDQKQDRHFLKKKAFLSCLKESDLVLGCTGSRSLSAKEMILAKKGAVFASLSISDREFDSLYFRQPHPPLSSCHEAVFFHDRWLLNAGFPWNFTQKFEENDREEFQLTRALTLLGVIIAVGYYGRTQIVELPLDEQAILVKKWQKIFPNIVQEA